MKIRSIGVLDSGVGGLSVLKRLRRAFPYVRFVYYGDNSNAPYGNKNRRELLSLAVNNINALISRGVEAVVLACNTLSLTVLSDLKRIFDVPIYAVFPPTEKLLLDGGSTLLLSTARTAERYKSCKNLTVVGLPNLAGDIERNIFRLDDINIGEHLNNIKGAFDNVILGCTHYFFVKDRICDHLKPRRVFDSAENTVKFVSEIGCFNKTSVKHWRNQIEFIGKNAEFNKKVWFSVVKGI